MKRIIPTIYLAAVLVLAISVTSQAQTLFRTCPITPAITGWAACTNPVWSAPTTKLVFTVARGATTLYLLPSSFLAGDAVFACSDPTAKAGPAGACPSLLPGQTNNWLAATAIQFPTSTTTPPPPPVTTPPPVTGAPSGGTWHMMWAAPNVGVLGQALPPMQGYNIDAGASLFGPWRLVATLPWPSADYVISFAAGEYCVRLTAVAKSGSLSDMSYQCVGLQSASAPIGLTLQP